MDNEKPTPKVIWSRLGGQLGVGLCAVGFLLVFLGWNGAASVDRIPSQFPYLISGGVGGLCFVVLGVGMIVVQSQRADRAALQATVRDLQDALERGGLATGGDGQRRAFARPGPRPAVEDTVEVHLTDLSDAPAAATSARKRPAKAAPRKATTAANAAKPTPRRRSPG